MTTRTEISENYTRWQETVDPCGTMSPEEFEAMSTEEKNKIQDECFGSVQCWKAWEDGKEEEAVFFEVPAQGSFDVAAAGADALGVEVMENLNVVQIF
jgi:hypothetical protein